MLTERKKVLIMGHFEGYNSMAEVMKPRGVDLVSYRQHQVGSRYNLIWIHAGDYKMSYVLNLIESYPNIPIIINSGGAGKGANFYKQFDAEFAEREVPKNVFHSESTNFENILISYLGVRIPSFKEISDRKRGESQIQQGIEQRTQMRERIVGGHATEPRDTSNTHYAKKRPKLPKVRSPRK